MPRKNRWLIFAVICVLAATQLACVLPAAIRGGGWLPSGDKKATLGFQITCDKDTGDVRGQFQWNDHWNKVAFHAVMDYNLPGCETGTFYTEYWGTYWPQPKNLGEGGTFRLQVDSEEPPCGKIELTGGYHDGYVFEGCMEGGNATEWEQED